VLIDLQTSERFKLVFEVPAGTTARVVVPASAGDTIRLDEQAVGTTSTDGQRVFESVPAGRHVVLAR
jgi:hypothetical protein